jgi:hypothetical protein
MRKRWGFDASPRVCSSRKERGLKSSTSPGARPERSRFSRETASRAAGRHATAGAPVPPSLPWLASTWRWAASNDADGRSQPEVAFRQHRGHTTASNTERSFNTSYWKVLVRGGRLGRRGTSQSSHHAAQGFRSKGLCMAAKDRANRSGAYVGTTCTHRRHVHRSSSYSILLNHRHEFCLDVVQDDSPRTLNLVVRAGCALDFGFCRLTAVRYPRMFAMVVGLDRRPRLKDLISNPLRHKCSSLRSKKLTTTMS